MSDLRYALRSLRRAPGFTAVAVLTLALGIGASTGVFSVVNAVLLTPLPYEEPERLVIVWNELPASALTRAPVSGTQFEALRQRSDLFQSVGGIWPQSRSLIDDEGSSIVSVAYLTPDFLDVLGVQLALGRGFAPDEGSGGRGAVIISDDLWRTRFGGDAGILGESVRLDGESAPIVGVMPPRFTLHFPPGGGVPESFDVYVPVPWVLADLPPAQRFLRVVARLRPERTIEQANLEVAQVAQGLRETFADLARAGDRLSAVPLRRDAVQAARPVLLALLTGVVLLLLLAAANVANLLLARTTARAAELSLRIALGATRRRVAAQLLAENTLLTIAGAVVGLWSGRMVAGLMWGLRPEGVAGADLVALDGRVLAFSLVVAVLAGCVFGLAPLANMPAIDPIHSLGLRYGRGGTGMRRARTRVCAAQVALGVALVAGTGLMARTLATLQNVDPGFDADGALTFRVALPERRFPSDGERARLAQNLEDRLREIPGVVGAGATSHLPYADWVNWGGPAAPDFVPESERQSFFADHRSITPGYVQALGIRLVEGRNLRVSDDAAREPVVIVDRAYAERTFPGGAPVGKRIIATRYVDGRFEPTPAVVVGVVDNVRDRSPSEASIGQVFWPFAQSARWEVTYVVRTAGDPLALAASVRAAVQDVNSDLAMGAPRLMREYADAATAAPRYTAVLAGVFAGIAVLLAALGVYSVISFSTTLRVHELGIRAALGADPRSLLRGVLSEGVRLGAWGVGTGLALALALTRFLEPLLYGVSPTDPVTLTAVAIAFIGVVAAATYLPARRAARIDPMEALRHE